MTLDTIRKLCEEMTFDDFTSIRDFAQRIGAEYCNGACKGCFVFPNFEYVIKFPRASSFHADNCEAEVAAYASAKTFGVEKVLLETKRLCYNKYLDLYFYYQPKVDEVAEYPSRQTVRRNLSITRTVSLKTYNLVTENLYYESVDSMWINTLIALYGKRFARSFEQWTRANRVNDLHDGNLGYKKKKPVIFDYAGF